MSLEQGLGLTGVSRGRPGRRRGDERSHAPDCNFIIHKFNPSSPGSEDSRAASEAVAVEFVSK